MPEYSAGNVTDYADGDRRVVVRRVRGRHFQSMANFSRGITAVPTVLDQFAKDAL